jgi:hypothetical protein
MDDDTNDLPPSEAARERRRDRDMDSRARAGMKTGLAKQFKQVLDAQVKRAKSTSAKQDHKAPDQPRAGQGGDERGRSRRRD